jgi:hypothetical protein
MQTTLTNEDLSALAAFSASLQPFKELSSAGSPLPFSIIIAFLAVAQRDVRAPSSWAGISACRRVRSVVSSQTSATSIATAARALVWLSSVVKQAIVEFRPAGSLRRER